MNIRVGAATDVGRTRTANEDSYLRDDDGQVFAVADGMGGHRAGDVASATAVETLVRELGDGSTLVSAIVTANDDVFSKAQANPEMRGMGTTVTAVQVDGEVALVGHVGDSRAYLVRDGQLTQITDDHSLVEELVRSGRLTPEEAVVHPQRNIVTRALGVDEDVEVDSFEIDLLPGDRLVLCSDGLTSMLRDEEIAPVLRSEADPQQAAEALVDAANRAGGEDNITVVVIDAVPDKAAKAAARKKAAAAGEDLEPGPADKTGEWAPVDAPDASAAGSAEETGEWVQLATAYAKSKAPAPMTGPAEGRAERPPQVKGRRRPLYRVLLWGLPFLLVLGVVFATLRWYARSTYYVGIEGEKVVLYRGVPDGFLVWDPTVESRTKLLVRDLPENDQDDLKNGHEFSSERSARQFISRLTDATTTTTTATTTTVPPPLPAPTTTVA